MELKNKKIRLIGFLYWDQTVVVVIVVHSEGDLCRKIRIKRSMLKDACCVFQHILGGDF